jgi:hypothetical protein
MPEECHHPDSPPTSGAADAPILANWRADELLGVRICLTVRLNYITPIKCHSMATRSRYNSVSVDTRLQDFRLDSSQRQNFSLLNTASIVEGVGSGAFGRGTALQTGRSRVRFLMGLLRAFFLEGRSGTRTPKHFVNLTGESNNFKMLEFPLNKLQILSIDCFYFFRFEL